MKLAITLFMLFCSVGSVAANYKVDHLEPMHWWVGMNNPQLQLLLHGKNIAELEPEVNYDGVSLLGVERTSNSNYLFVNLQISPAAKAGELSIRLMKNGTPELTLPYRLESRLAGSALRSSFSAKDAVYLITPDRFVNGDIRNDSHAEMLEHANRMNPVGRHGGDIKGVTTALKYIADMGFTMLWPTPLIENNQSEYSYHGYSPTNLYRIDPRFGSNEDYRKLVAAANKQGIGVIQDIVLNHIGDGHWWMKDLPANDWLNHQTGFVPTNNQHTTVLDIHAAPEDLKMFTDGWFVESMPDMNQRNPLLANYLVQNTIWWIEYANLSGIREDTYAYSDKAFLSRWVKAVLDEYPNFNIVGEEMNSNPHILAYWQRGASNRDGYKSNLPSLMDFPVVFLMPEVLNAEESSSSGLIKLYEMIANDFVYADAMSLMVFPDNHDMSRIYSLLHENLNLWKTSILFTATTRGIPQIYYGTEVLATSPIVRDDGLLRSDFPGGWGGDKVNAFTGKGLTMQQREAQSYLKKLLQWRKTSLAVEKGKLVHYIPAGGHYVYFRQHKDEMLMVVLNKNKQPSHLALSRFKSMLNHRTSGVDIISGKRITLDESLILSPLQSIAISFK
ncbi:glycoside hydrolase family 13 protein [Cellvibrio sp. OA-2007]|uniref:glycoside hydrolase family 13 protein n=1 Tax=Cellvibrio sp. OA-2007 TaxID=529823 RepID=UPI00078404E6|nr:glycoside hydrolase family 13 protein [Cellvibrio sp. OA-2007]